jgi:integrase
MSLPATLTESVKHYKRAAMADNTRHAYAIDCRIFAQWAISRRLRPFPAEPDTLAAFIADQAATGVLAASTISRRVAAIVRVHRAKNWPSPVNEAVREVLAGVRRELGTRPAGRDPLVYEDMRRIIACTDGPDRLAIRDRALLLLGWYGALRRSELAALRVEDIAETPEGLIIDIPRSKTDQDAAGQQIAVPRGVSAQMCPVAALHAWLDRAHIASGRIFPLTGYAIALIVKRRARAAGIDPARVSGHSLRSGALTSAAMAGAGVFKLRELSRHRSTRSLEGYVKRIDLWKDHALIGVGQ